MTSALREDLSNFLEQIKNYIAGPEHWKFRQRKRFKLFSPCFQPKTTVNLHFSQFSQQYHRFHLFHRFGVRCTATGRLDVEAERDKYFIGDTLDLLRKSSSRTRDLKGR